VVLCPISQTTGSGSQARCRALTTLVLAAGDVILDDRNERPGAMFTNWNSSARAAPRHDRRPGFEGVNSTSTVTPSSPLDASQALSILKGKLGLRSPLERARHRLGAR
jgi:hypothetical protein